MSIPNRKPSTRATAAIDLKGEGNGHEFSFGFRFPSALKELCSTPEEHRAQLLHDLFENISKLPPQKLIAAWHTMQSFQDESLSDEEVDEILECIRIAMELNCLRSPENKILRKQFEMVLGYPVSRPIKNLARLWLRRRLSPD